MNNTYPSLLDIYDEIAKYGLNYKKLSDDHILVYAPGEEVKFTRQRNNTWAKDRIGFQV